MLSIFAFSSGVCLISTLMFALIPALQTSKLDIAGALKAESGTSFGNRAKSRMRSAMVLVQVALSFILVVGGALLVQSLFSDCGQPIPVFPRTIWSPQLLIWREPAMTAHAHSAFAMILWTASRPYPEWNLFHSLKSDHSATRVIFQAPLPWTDMYRPRMKGRPWNTTRSDPVF